MSRTWWNCNGGGDERERRHSEEGDCVREEGRARGKQLQSKERGILLQSLPSS